jgi:hypothetical protein
MSNHYTGRETDSCGEGVYNIHTVLSCRGGIYVLVHVFNEEEGAAIKWTTLDKGDFWIESSKMVEFFPSTV